MSLKRKCLWILTVLLAVPMLAARAPAAPYQGGGYGGRHGEGGRRGPMSPDERLKRMTKDFNLTADQQAKIKPILVDAQKKMEDLRNDSNGDRPAMRQKMMAEQDAIARELKLTPDLVKVATAEMEQAQTH